MMKEFRNKDIDVLVATAIIEEGLDVADCNLVIRFNKPQNFSSYMQSKGRARAKANACYVILRDEADMDEWSANNHEYKDYEHMAKVWIEELIFRIDRYFVRLDIAKKLSNHCRYGCFN